MDGLLLLIALVAVTLFIFLNGMREVDRLLATVERRIPSWTETINLALGEAGHRASVWLHDMWGRRRRIAEQRVVDDVDLSQAAVLPPRPPTETAPRPPANETPRPPTPETPRPPTGGTTQPPIHQTPPRRDLEIGGKPYTPVAASPRPQAPRPGGGPGWGIREQTKPFGDEAPRSRSRPQSPG